MNATKEIAQNNKSTALQPTMTERLVALAKHHKRQADFYNQFIRQLNQ